MLLGPNVRDSFTTTFFFGFVVGTLGGVGFAGVATPPEGFGFGGVVGAGVTLIAVT